MAAYLLKGLVSSSLVNSRLHAGPVPPCLRRCNRLQHGQVGASSGAEDYLGALHQGDVASSERPVPKHPREGYFSPRSSGVRIAVRRNPGASAPTSELS